MPSPCFTGIPRGHFGAAIVDPPWPFRTWSAKGRGKCADQHYGCLQVPEIEALPVGSLLRRDAAIALWFPQQVAHVAPAVMLAWGFAPRTLGAWAKRSSTGQHWAFGNGKILRCAAEFYLIGVRGHPPVRSKSVRNLIVAPAREHSRKPDQLHASVEALFDGPYVELFARRHYPGWTCWGDQLEPLPPPKEENPNAVTSTALAAD
jgi:N6-adenosine-specific RNA methylase IME4